MALDYLSDWTLYYRIRDAYKEHNSLIVAYDIDDTVRPYRASEESCRKVRELLKEVERYVPNIDFIVFSANLNLDNVAEFLVEENLPWNYINENSELVPGAYFNQDKIYYHILLDDKAGLSESYRCLKRFVEDFKK